MGGRGEGQRRGMAVDSAEGNGMGCLLVAGASALGGDGGFALVGFAVEVG